MQQVCPTCSGTGAVVNQKAKTAVSCPTCQGTGVVSAGFDDQDFFYPINVVLTALQVGVIGTVAIDNDADFLCDRFIASSILTGGAAGLFSVTLLNKFKSMPFSPSNINGENISGTAQNPFWLPNPMLIRKNAVIQGTFTERSNNGNTVQFCLVGRKLL